jgi:hypothetical protein
VWNGTASTGFQLDSISIGDVGIIFRAIDKVHYVEVTYLVTDDKIHAITRNGGLGDYNIYTSAALGWSSSVMTALHYFRVDFYYQTITIYISDDNVIWTQLTSVHCNNLQGPGFVRRISKIGQDPSTYPEYANFMRNIEAVPTQIGYVGLFAI